MMKNNFVLCAILQNVDHQYTLLLAILNLEALVVTIRIWFEQLKSYFTIPLLTLGSNQITIQTMISLVVFSTILFFLTGMLRKWIVEQLLTRSKMDIGARQATGSIIRYFIIVIGFIIILQTVGIDLTALNVLAGAVGIGLGFGLQNIVNNFISGIIILFERPIKVGDRIEVGNVEGDVVRVGGRSTEVVTNDNITIIIPNSKFITENVINWSHNDRKVRFRIPVTVAFGSDVRLVERVLLEVAEERSGRSRQTGSRSPLDGVRRQWSPLRTAGLEYHSHSPEGTADQ